MYISYMCIYEQHIEIVIGWHMVYMCVHYIFTQLTRIKGLQDSFTLVCDVEAGAQTFVLIPQQKSFKKSLFLFLPWPQTISMKQFLTLVWITGYFPLANSLEESCCNQFRGHCASSMCFLILCCKWFPEELNFCCFCPCWSTPCILLKQDQFWDLDCPFFLTKVFSLKLNNKTRTLWHSFFVVVVVKMLSLYVYVLFLEQAIFLPVPLLYLRTHLI